MSDLHFAADEFRRLASTVRNVADAVRQARPGGGVNAFASTTPGMELTSLVQSVEEKRADMRTVLGRSLGNHADSLDAADRGFITTEEDNGQFMSSIIRGLGFGSVSKR